MCELNTSLHPPVQCDITILPVVIKPDYLGWGFNTNAPRGVSGLAAAHAAHAAHAGHAGWSSHTHEPAALAQFVDAVNTVLLQLQVQLGKQAA